MSKVKLLIIATLFFTACSIHKLLTPQDSTLLTIGDSEVSTKEFLYFCSKNNYKDIASIRKEVEDYLDLFINFKLKVKEAEELGLQNTSVFLEEFGIYKDQLAKPYLTESLVTKSLVKEAYDRTVNEVRVSHILIKVAENASPEDTLDAYNKIIALKKRAVGGEDFGVLAQENSEDPSAKINHGDLGYFSALKMVYPFENAAYNTQVGKISDPVRTRFGYHLIKVSDKRKSHGQTQVAHIMIQVPKGMDVKKAEKAREKITEIKEKIGAGANWNEMAYQFSDDPNTKKEGGLTRWFGGGDIIPEFAENAFKLDSIGQISEPFQTPYGWHIIKLMGKKPVPAFNEIKQDLTKKIEKDSRSRVSKKLAIKKLQKESKYQVISENLEKTKSIVDETVLSGKWVTTTNMSISDEPLLKISDKTYSIGNFLTYIEFKQKKNSRLTKNEYVQKLFDQYSKEKLIAYEEDRLVSKNEDYAMLLKEYRDGILLFQLMDDKVWSKGVKDTAGLKTFFELNREDYMWGERAQTLILNAETLEILDSALSLISQPNGFVYYSQSMAMTPVDSIGLNRLTRKAADNHAYRLTFNQADASHVKKWKASIQQLAVKSSIIKLIEKEDSPEGKIKIELIASSAHNIEQALNKQSKLAIKVTKGLLDKKDSDIFEKIDWKAGTYQMENDSRFYYVKIDSIAPPQKKELKETKGLVISDYQNLLEKGWVKKLREKYIIKVDEKGLEEIITHLEKTSL